jgi:transposase
MTEATTTLTRAEACRQLGVSMAAVIRIDAVWLAAAPLDMRAGTDTALARVVAVFSAAHPHQAYLFANRRANRMNLLVHDGFGIWLCARRLHRGRFTWSSASAHARLALTRAQFDALALDLPCGVAAPRRRWRDQRSR